LIALVFAAAISDLCGPAPAPIALADPQDAARYVEVGDEAKRAGDNRVALVAYRSALARDPGNAAASAAITELCRAEPTNDDELLSAIALFRAGELDASAKALGPLAARGDAGAHFFLGAIGLAQHAGGSAVLDLELAAADPQYAESARILLPLARRDGPVSAIVLVAPEIDTNPQLLPDTPPSGSMLSAPRTDEDLLMAATVTAHPTRWLYVRDAFAWREQRVQDEVDLLTETATAGVELGTGATRWGGHYDFDYALLSNAEYLFAHRGTVNVQHELGPAALVGEYALRRRDFQQVAQAAFTGWVQTGDGGAIVHLSPRFDLDARGMVTREHTEDPTFSNYAVGATVAARMRPMPGMRLAAQLAGWYAIYDGAEPDGSLRRDGHAEASVDVEYDLSDHSLATCGAGVIGNDSTIDDFDYAKLVVRCGLAFAIGGP
jgi:hypothetical protein